MIPTNFYLKDKIGSKVRFYYYNEFGMAQVTGKIIDTTDREYETDLKIEVDYKFSNLPNIVRIPERDIIEIL